MADDTPTEGLDSAEKAFAAATEASLAKDSPAEPVTPPVTPPPVAPVAVAAAPAPKAAPVPAPVVAPKVAAPVAKLVVKAPVKAAPVKAAVAPKPAAAPIAKPAAKLAPKPVSAKKAKPTKKVVAVAKPAAKASARMAPPVATPVAKKSVAPAKAPAASTPITQLKDTIMATKSKTTEFTAKLKGAFAGATTKAKEVYAKGTAVVGEATEFTKGNVEAMVASGKILADGYKGLGTEYVAEAKKAFETATTDVKELTAVKSPTEFFQLQAKIMRRNFDSAVALGSKNTEAAVKLAGDAFVPISSRVSLAVEKVKAAA